jgi:hypothetical protein
VRGRDLLHPLPLAAVALLVFNDHVLKASGWAPPALTGKLSDVAGLFFFPILLFTLTHPPRVRRAWVAVAAAGLTAVVFAAIKLDVRANALAAWALGSCALDPTDLLALPMTGLAALFCLRREHAPEGRRLARTAAMVVASLASVATSRAYRPPCPAVPTGEAHRSADTLCARTPGATVATAASEVSITLDLTPNEPGCSMPLKGLAIDQRPRADVSARTVIKVPLAPLQQGTRLQLHTALPYPAACESLRLGLLLEGAIVDLPIVACGPKGEP